MTLRTYDILGEPKDIGPVLKILKKYRRFEYNPSSPDFVIPVGGDGTTLTKPIKEKLYKIPVLFIHNREGTTDSLGFSMDVYKENLDLAMEDMERGAYFPQEEKLLDCIINDKIRDTAINDVVIGSIYRSSGLRFKAAVDTQNPIKKLRYIPLPRPIITHFILSRNRGSTAWSYSAGGPIDIDRIDQLHITYESSTIKQAIFNCNPNDRILVKALRDSVVIVDAGLYEVKTGSRITILGSDKTMTVIRTINTLEPLREKLVRQNLFNIADDPKPSRKVLEKLMRALFKESGSEEWW